MNDMTLYSCRFGFPKLPKAFLQKIHIRREFDCIRWGLFSPEEEPGLVWSYSDESRMKLVQKCAWVVGRQGATEVGTNPRILLLPRLPQVAHRMLFGKSHSVSKHDCPKWKRVHWNHIFCNEVIFSLFMFDSGSFIYGLNNNLNQPKSTWISLKKLESA